MAINWTHTTKDIMKTSVYYRKYRILSRKFKIKKIFNKL